MADEYPVTFHPWDTETTAETGTTLLEAATAAGVGIESLCGGEGLCGTCKVVVDDGTECLSSPTKADEYLLNDDQLAAGYRLSCRAEVRDGPVTVSVPRESQQTGGIVLTEGRELEFDLDPAITQYHLELPAPSLEDNTADRERVLQALETDYGVSVDTVDFTALTELPNDLREHARDGTLSVTATVYDDRELIALTPGVNETRYGLAVDVGTTTVAVYLLDLSTGDVVAVSAMLNPQEEFGGDIMTRVRYTRRNDDGRQRMQDAIIDGVNECIDAVTTEASVSTDDIYEAVFVGNTAMHHLFLGIEPGYVAGSPYVAANHAPVAVKARELGVDVNDAGYLYWLPICGGWVGPDKVSVLLVSAHYKEDEMTVCIDIGTNGEISVGNVNKLWTTSAPAGPALEGAEITHGVRAQAGAIDDVSVNPKTKEPSWTTIGDEAPIGICGSGVIAAVAGLFRAGVVDRRGQFRDTVMDHPRVRLNEDDVVEYVIARSDETGIDGDVVLTQLDIREIQMAKAAIQAGTRVLMDELDVEQVDRVVLAGGFGNYIDPESALTCGLYPDVPLEKVESLGNAAGIGAQLCLLNTAAREEAERIVDIVEYYEIAGTDVFRDNFMAAMYLPHRERSLYPGVMGRIEAIRPIEDVEK